MRDETLRPVFNLDFLALSESPDRLGIYLRVDVTYFKSAFFFGHGQLSEGQPQDHQEKDASKRGWARECQRWGWTAGFHSKDRDLNACLHGEEGDLKNSANVLAIQGRRRRKKRTDSKRASGTGWRRPIGCLKLQVIFRNRVTN